MKKDTISTKKALKRSTLIESAYNLFLTKGLNKTTVDDIVKKAKVAKGTFYLYFKDKDDIADKIIIETSEEYINNAIIKTKEANISSFEDSIVYLVNCLIDEFNDNKDVLLLIKKDFSWNLLLKELDKMSDSIVKDYVKELLSKSKKISNYTDIEILTQIYMIIEMVGSVCYSSIIKSEPAPIEEMRPYIIAMVEKIVS